ncbi:MAG TPA: pirin family protein [Caulobacteraceae bacterium]|nr:pirin family protein [Caulobacteraceae bacterium]
MIELVIDAVRKDLGGFEVGRILPFAKKRMVGPFVFLDHLGPAAFAPGSGIDVRPHPHIGLSTVTYLMQGRIFHQDNLGYRQAITPGEVNWMTAGRGIVHSERTEAPLRESGQAMHGLQAWVALPVENEEDAPAFHHHGPEDLPTFEDGKLWGRLVAGAAYGLEATVKTHSPLFYVHWEMQPGARGGLPGGHTERAAYVAAGTVSVDGREFSTGQMVVFGADADPVIEAVTHATVMLLGGESLGHRYIWWNLVSHSMDRIEQAKADWKAGRFSLPPQDNQEFIPLPETPPPPAQSL